MPKHNEPNPEQLTTLMHLVRLGAVSSFTSVSTRTLGAAIGLSQQAASLRLVGLEKAGLVERARSGRGLGVRLTNRGLEKVEAFLADVGTNLDRLKDVLAFRGTVFTGLGEGRYYVSLKGYSSSFKKAVGFWPYPGTLNLRLTGEASIEQRRRLDLMKGIEVAEFRDDRRTYGPVKCFRAEIGGKHPGAALAIERTHHDSSVLEVISPICLRKAMGLSDGDECSVTVYLGEGWVRRR